MSKLNETVAAAVKTVLDSAPEGLGERSREWSRERLENGTNFGSYASFDFEREWPLLGRGSVSLTLSMEETGQPITVGDSILSVSQMKVTLNWPAYGSGSPALARKRVEMMMEFVEFAERLESLHGSPVHEVIDTVAAREARDQERRDQVEKRRVEGLVREWLEAGDKTKFQHVNKPRVFSLAEFPGDIAPGEHTIELKGKSFRVQTTNDGLWATVFRLS